MAIQPDLTVNDITGLQFPVCVRQIAPNMIHSGWLTNVSDYLCSRLKPNCSLHQFALILFLQLPSNSLVICLDFPLSDCRCLISSWAIKINASVKTSLPLIDWDAKYTGVKKNKEKHFKSVLFSFAFEDNSVVLSPEPYLLHLFGSRLLIATRSIGISPTSVRYHHPPVPYHQPRHDCARQSRHCFVCAADRLPGRTDPCRDAALFPSFHFLQISSLSKLPAYWLIVFVVIPPCLCVCGYVSTVT